MSGLSVRSALLAASVAAHDAEAEPRQRSEHGDDNRVEPQRPGEVQEQEVEPDVLGVLHDKDDEHADTG